jgi:DNA-binding transcriptional LysR family regulator
MQNDLAASHIGEWVSQFAQALPDTAFYVELDYSAQMSQDLLVGELDLAVLFTPRHLPDLHFEMVAERLHVDRRQRQQQLHVVIQDFANRLAALVRAAPYNWFNFYDFWNEPAPGDRRPGADGERRARG